MENIESLIAKVDGGNNAFLKELYGVDAAVLKKQAERYIALIKSFKTTFNADKAAVFSSPGRTEIGGNHTDHNYGRVLAGAVNLDNIAVAAPNGTNVVRIHSLGYPTFEVDLSKKKLTT